jgi:hypothetical protein
MSRESWQPGSKRWLCAQDETELGEEASAMTPVWDVAAMSSSCMIMSTVL